MSKLVPTLPSGVHLSDEGLVDEHLDATVPLNPTAHVMVSQVDGKKGISEIIETVAKKFNVEEEIISNDIGGLFKDLQKNYMINWEQRSGNRMKDVLLRLFGQYKPGYFERFEMTEMRFFDILLRMMQVVLRKIVIFWAIFMLLFIPSYVYTQSEFLLQLAYYFTIVYFGLITGFALHETMHAYLHRKMEPRRVGFLAADWMSIRFVRPVIMPYPKKMIWVTLLGPLVPGSIGVIGLLLVPFINGNDTIIYTLNTFFITYALHLFYLLPFTGDGKSVINQIMYFRMQKKMSAK
jgi:hypothetical protein